MPDSSPKSRRRPNKCLNLFSNFVKSIDADFFFKLTGKIICKQVNMLLELKSLPKKWGGVSKNTHSNPFRGIPNRKIPIHKKWEATFKPAMSFL